MEPAATDPFRLARRRGAVDVCEGANGFELANSIAVPHECEKGLQIAGPQTFHTDTIRRRGITRRLPPQRTRFL